MVFFILANASLAFIPLFIGQLVGSLAHKPIDTNQACIYTAVLIALSFCHSVLWHFSEWLYLKLLNPLDYRFENIIYSQVIRKPYPYFVDKFTGKVGSYISTLGEEYKTVMNSIFWDYIGQLVSLVGVTIVLTALNWETGLIFMAGLILLLVIGRYTVKNSIKYERRSADVQSTKRGIIIDSVGNFVNVKSFHKESAEINIIRDEQEKTIKIAQRSFWYNLIFWASMGSVVRELIWPTTIALNVYLYIHNEISLATLTAFLSAIFLFTNFIWEIIWHISKFNLKLAKIEEAYTYLFGNVNVVEQYFNEQQRAANPAVFLKDFKLSGLDFAYPDKADHDVLSNINLTIKKGEKIGIVGKSGSGKTTLTKILLGYYQVDPAKIMLDSQATDTRDLAHLISYVPQDTTLFHRTITENISYAADKQVSKDDVVKAAEKAHAHEFIAKLTQDYDTLVGERGVKLSAGQRQRIAIARAFLDDKPILILDEATSALDSESEVLIQEALEALWHDKTVIAIAHRLSTLRNMDRIIVMDDGKIVEQGTHKELLDKNGKYAKLWSHQSGGFLDE